MKCPICSGTTREESRTHHYEESGLLNVYIKGVTVNVCACGEEYIQIPGIDEIDRLIGEKLLAKELILTGAEIKFLRKWLDLTSEEFAATIGVGRATISRWENGKTPVHKLTDRVIRLYVAEVKGVTLQVDRDDLFPSTPLPMSASEERIELEAQELPIWGSTLLPASFFSTEWQGVTFAPSCYKVVKEKKSEKTNDTAANQELAQAA